MGKYNEIQEESTQSWGSNSFTTTVKEDTVEFDSAKDKFTFKDAVEVPSLKVNGSQVSAQVQSDWNQTDDTKADYIKNKPTIPDAVSVTQIETSGTNIASITIGDTTTQLYAPTGGGLTNLVDGSATGSVRGISTAAEGSGYTIGQYAVAEGKSSTASGKYAHAEGKSSTASGQSAHAEGNSTTASGDYSHAEGYRTTASDTSHAEGVSTTASGLYSHAEGNTTTANHKSQHVFGEYNIEDPSSAGGTARGNYIEIVGNGTLASARSNARTLDWSGNEQVAGTLRIGSTSTGGALLKFESNALKVSFDNGTTWKTVTLS